MEFSFFLSVLIVLDDVQNYTVLNTSMMLQYRPRVSLKPREIALPRRNFGYSGGETTRYSIVISSKTIDSDKNGSISYTVILPDNRILKEETNS